MRPTAVSAIYFPFRRHLTALRLLLTRRHRSREKVAAFEKRFAEIEDVPEACATSMARTGLYQVLKSLNVLRGDKILMTPVNIPEMRAVVDLLGLQPVFVDFAPHSLTADPEDLEGKIHASGAKILFLTHLAGQLADMEKIRSLCERNGVVLIQDSTQAPLCRFREKPLGRWADFSLYSTCELKFIHTYRGALIGVNRTSSLEALRATLSETPHFQKASHALTKAFADLAASVILHPRLFALVFHRFQNRFLKQNPLAAGSAGVRVGPFLFFGDDAAKMRTGLPRRMHFRASDFEAGLGDRALDEVKTLVRHHRELADLYRERLSEWNVLPRVAEASESSAWRFPLLLPSAEQADLFLKRMREQGVGVERTGLQLLAKDTPVARDSISRLVFLPSHRGVSREDAGAIAARAENVFRELGLTGKPI